MKTTPDACCEFCDGTGRWTDSASGTADPCFVCEGTGRIVVTGKRGPDAPDGGVRLLTTVARLTQGERQRLYEALYRQWNCRIYKP